jgi:hypothetical protein
MSNPAPEAEANPWRRAAQQSAPSSMIAALAMAASTHRSGVPSGAGPIVRTAIRQVNPARTRVIRFAAPRRGMRVGGEPAGENYG